MHQLLQKNLTFTNHLNYLSFSFRRTYNSSSATKKNRCHGGGASPYEMWCWWSSFPRSVLESHRLRGFPHDCRLWPGAHPRQNFISRSRFVKYSLPSNWQLHLDYLLLWMKHYVIIIYSQETIVVSPKTSWTGLKSDAQWHTTWMWLCLVSILNYFNAFSFQQ